MPNKSRFPKDCCCSMGNFCLFYSSPLCLFQRDGAVAEGGVIVGPNVPKFIFQCSFLDHSTAYRFGLLDIHRYVYH